MPALIVHDCFAREEMERNPDLAGESTEEADAFLLGNQGPDPLFFSVLVPHLVPFHRLGHAMHEQEPAMLLWAMKESLGILSDADLATGRAYALGFLAHYALDAVAHPFIYAQQYALCDAGVPGLSRRDGHEVHAYIECELDEAALFRYHGETIRTFRPWERVLAANDHTLGVVSLMYSYAALRVYGTPVTPDLFGRSVKAYRRAERFFYTPDQGKRAILGEIERMVRPHSFYCAFAMRDVERTQTPFENAEHAPWTNPFTEAASTESFADLVARAHTWYEELACDFEHDGFDMDAAHAATGDLNFTGRPTSALLLAVENA